ncbi:MAG: porin [Pseudomonadota bacterium]
MNIKSFLLGSAAAMIAVTGAQAADAIVVEPEPVEYVRVCDAYGSGFFFIPGTETCIRLGGFVRSSYEKDYLDISNTAGVTTSEESRTFWGQRARLNVDVRNETDYGTLRALYRLEAGDDNEDADIDMDIALISLAGFRAGFAGANYWTSNHNFAGVNFQAIGAAFTPNIDEGWYGFDDATIFDYTWSADGFSITIGVEDPRISNANNNSTNSGGADGRANFYAGANFTYDKVTVAFTAVHDSLAVSQTDSGTGGWAYKVSADLDLSEYVPGGVLHGMFMTDENYRTDYVHNWGGLYDPEYIWQASFQSDVTDELQFVAQYSYADGDDTEGDGWNAGIGLNYFPSAAPGLSLNASYKFGEIENVDTGVAGGVAGDGIPDTNIEMNGWFVGVRRNF